MRCLVAVVLGAIALLVSQPAAACDRTSPANEVGRSQWYCANASPTVFVFVHGLNSNNAAAWSHKTDADQAFWPELVRQDAYLRVWAGQEPPSILLASFHTGPSSRGFSIKDAREQIFDALFTSIDGQPPAIEKRTIILIGHSLGGVLLRDMLSQHADRFVGKQLGLLLVASPSKGSNFANVASYAQWAVDNTMVRELEQGSTYLDEVHARFAKAVGEGGALKFLVGRELFEHLGMLEAAARCASNTLSISGVACAAKQRFYSYVEGGPVVPEQSAVVYWPELARPIPQSDHSSIARPTDTGHPTHQALRELVEATHQAAVNPCVPPANFGVTFSIRADGAQCRAQPARDATAPFELVQLNVEDGQPLRDPLQVRYDRLTGLYRLPISEPPFPCTNEVFWGKLLPRVQSSRRMTTEPCATDVCFRRSRRAPAAKFALFNCVAGDKCLVPDKAPGVAEGCQDADRTAIMAALPKPAAEDYWAAPSLDTLEMLDPAARPGYTEFYIVSDPLKDIPDGAHVGYGVTVNGRPLRFDGMPPFFRRQPVTKGSRVHITFPVENLGFRGAADGYEDVQVELRFFRGEQAIATATLQRRYVAYRHGAAMTQTDAETGETFHWRAVYRPATTGANFEVVLEHGSELNWMKERRVALDGLSKSFDGRPVIGVIRPGRSENRRIGMILGLVQESGQVRSLFVREEADKLCRWIMEQPDFNKLQKIGAYIFEFPNETFDDRNDRGRQVADCSAL